MMLSVFGIMILLVFIVVLWAGGRSENSTTATEKSQPSSIQTTQSVRPQPPQQVQPDKNQPDKAALIAAAMTKQLEEQGSDVRVFGFDDVLVFDCTKALDPRTACYVLYKGYPQSQDELKLLQLMGIHKLRFNTEGGWLHDFAWSKELPRPKTNNPFREE